MTNDAFLFYNEGNWGKYGLAVPNYGNDTHTQNTVILDFVQTAGRNLQAIMWSVDARKRRPPTINVLKDIHKLCIRSRNLMASAVVPSGKENMRAAHALPAPEVFLVYPTPYFTVRNSWLKNYCSLTLLAITEAMQHTENAQPLEISQAFKDQVGQYIRRVYRMMATDLFQIPVEVADAPDFTMTEEQLASYAPEKYFTPTEMIDTVPNLFDWPTEDDLEVLTNGIPVVTLPKLGRYPTSALGSPQTGNGGVAPNASIESAGSSW